MAQTVVRSLVFAGVALLSTTQPVAAQSAVYVGAAGFADIKRFDSVEYDPRVLASGDDFSLDATGAGGGVRVGTFLHPRWSLELAVDAGTRTKKAMANPYLPVLGAPASLRFPELAASTRFLTVSTIIGFHTAKAGRVQLGYLGGFSFVRGTYQSDLPSFIIAPSAVSFSGGPSTIPTSVSAIATAILPGPFTTRAITRHDNSTGAVFGFEAAIDLTRRIAAVPGIRALATSMTGQSVFLIRPEIGVRWSF
jgi:hypothetical protein